MVFLTEVKECQMQCFHPHDSAYAIIQERGQLSLIQSCNGGFTNTCRQVPQEETICFHFRSFLYIFNITPITKLLLYLQEQSDSICILSW